VKRAVLCIVVLVASSAGATSPERYSQGLDAHTSDDAYAGIVVLRPVPRGRVRIPGGTFQMGATPMEMLHGVQLCQHEPLGTLVVPVIMVDAKGNHVTHNRSVHCDVIRFEVEGIAHPVTISSFWMDRTEVRVGDYMRCVSAGACHAPGFSPADVHFSAPDLPVVLVTWEDARDYCGFAKGRLPSEAEWEYAARGTLGRTFPWGNDWNPHLANHGSIALDRSDASDGFAYLAPVGSFPDGKSPLGLLDMAGNASEWVADTVDADATDNFPEPYLALAQTNPHPRAANETCIADTECASHICKPRAVDKPELGSTCDGGGSRRIIRGGSYLEGADSQRSTARILTTPTRRYREVGFRCAANE
jgi:formylglycine-generating enzyme required for sulfatase activity